MRQKIHFSKWKWVDAINLIIYYSDYMEDRTEHKIACNWQGIRIDKFVCSLLTIYLQQQEILDKFLIIWNIFSERMKDVQLQDVAWATRQRYYKKTKACNFHFYPKDSHDFEPRKKFYASRSFTVHTKFAVEIWPQ